MAKENFQKSHNLSDLEKMIKQKNQGNQAQENIQEKQEKNLEAVGNIVENIKSDVKEFEAILKKPGDNAGDASKSIASAKKQIISVSQYAAKKYGFTQSDQAYTQKFNYKDAQGNTKEGGREYVVVRAIDGTKQHYQKDTRGDYFLSKLDEKIDGEKVITYFNNQGDITSQQEKGKKITGAQVEIMAGGDVNRHSRLESEKTDDNSFKNKKDTVSSPLIDVLDNSSLENNDTNATPVKTEPETQRDTDLDAALAAPAIIESQKSVKTLDQLDKEKEKILTEIKALEASKNKLNTDLDAALAAPAIIESQKSVKTLDQLDKEKEKILTEIKALEASKNKLTEKEVLETQQDTASDAALAAIDTAMLKRKPINILEQKLSEQEKKTGPFMQKLGLFGKRLQGLQEGKKGKTWYGKYVAWQNEGSKTTKLAKKVVIGAGIAALVGGTAGIAGAGIAGGLAIQRILVSAGAGAGASFLHKKLTQKGLEKDLASYKGLRNEELTNKKSQLENESIRLTGGEFKKLRLLRIEHKGSGKKPQELQDLEKKYEEFNSQRTSRFSETKKNYRELFRRRESKNDRNNKLVAAGAGLLTGLGMRYGEDILDLINQDKNVPLVPSKPVKLEIPVTSEQIESPISADAYINKGEGITHALKRQLEDNPDIAKKLGIIGKPTGSDLARIAKDFGYINDDGSDVRVFMGRGAAYELTLDDTGNPIVKEHFGGHIQGEQYLGGTTKEINIQGAQFEGGSHEGIAMGTGEYEYINGARTPAQGVDLSTLAGAPTEPVGINLENLSDQPELTTNSENIMNTNSEILRSGYPGHRMVVNNMFDEKFAYMHTDRSVMELFNANGVGFNQKNFTMIGYCLAENRQGIDMFVNINSGNPDKLMSWQDIYEQTDFDQLKKYYPNMDMIASKTGVNLDAMAQKIGFDLNDAAGNEVVPEKQLSQEPFIQQTGHFEVIHDEQGNIGLRHDENFRFTGEMETGSFTPREERLLEQGKFDIDSGMPPQGRIPELGLNNAGIIILKNGQYVFQNIIASSDAASGLGDGTRQLNKAMNILGMPNQVQHAITDNQPIPGTTMYRTRVFTPISEQQAQYIGKIYSEMRRFTGMNNPNK
jgi:hypothetical protein